MRYGASFLGRLCTSTEAWSLTLRDRQFVLQVAERLHSGSTMLLENLDVTPGLLWSTVHIVGANGQVMTLDGISNGAARHMLKAIQVSVVHHRHVDQLLGEFANVIELVKAWASDVHRSCTEQFQKPGWLSQEFKGLIAARRPTGLDKLLAVPEVAQHLSGQDEETQAAVTLWRNPVPETLDSLNRRHLANELQESRPFFDTVEKSPLTREQAEAVITFDNRVLLIASAGSGKTSTMVAKAGYALQKGYFAPERMLLLAFNNDAAAELRERIRSRLTPLGLPADQIVAKTFHAFGLEVIGAATGKKPTLAPWVESGRDQDTLLKMVDELKDSDTSFRTAWDMFRLVFGQDLPKFGKEEESPEAWDRASGRNGFWTLKGDVVKSRGELVLANWFFYMGVDYVYEGPYKVDLADATHRQYHPDFYLPGIDAYLEHWALDAHGEPPAAFTGYKEGMAWKKQIHAQHQTVLLETTMAQLWSGQAFVYLAQELTRRGITLDPNPDRKGAGRQPIESPRLVRTIRQFLTHAKSNRLSMVELRNRLDTGAAGQFRFRHAMFLDIFEKLWSHWEYRLQGDGAIDFDDMLNLATDCIERGQWASPYELVMVDEFQDASQARARLISGLIQQPGRYLFAVGDDWQSINRFAGADLSVMTDFESKFGKAVTLKLETTFRCPQALCDISSKFVQKNPRQLRKSVRSPKNDVAQPVRIVSVREELHIRSAVESRIAQIAAEHPGGDYKIKIYILGRYRHDSEHQPRQYDPSRVEVEFITVHSSKGLEADHIILPRITSETLGFPSRIIDDPVLQLAMPGGDGYEYAEERRLFYVALTRARSSVTLITVARKESSFVKELLHDHQLTILNADGSENSDELCPTCGAGFLTMRKGPYGSFWGCSTYPKCKHIKRLPRT
ncbi:UvrD-helicase domain-containing protein [Curvibacter sp. APW13]|uniref:UvrD-helicase domain-containing protein n=1 Tax=Curvibacter sp. APW13 TaxID=3077236 RepID=UPI0028DE1BD8|nr:UvrD-helicase domain-containing protein [Curvibacter sp. APW13]MDT8990572.1 UvrD-helicase domain-containing protein [Curvibacter sp. APW13]